MKTIVILFTALCFSGCSFISRFDTSGASMTCNINGKSWEASQATAINLLGAVNITGDAGEGGTILLTVSAAGLKEGSVVKIGGLDPAAIGEDLNLAASLTSYTKMDADGNNIMYAAKDGQVNITTFTKSEIAGTFYFTGTNITGNNPENKITEGKFSANIMF